MPCENLCHPIISTKISPCACPSPGAAESRSPVNPSEAVEFQHLIRKYKNYRNIRMLENNEMDIESSTFCVLNFVHWVDHFLIFEGQMLRGRGVAWFGCWKSDNDEVCSKRLQAWRSRSSKFFIVKFVCFCLFLQLVWTSEYFDIFWYFLIFLNVIHAIHVFILKLLQRTKARRSRRPRSLDCDAQFRPPGAEFPGWRILGGEMGFLVWEIYGFYMGFYYIW